MAVDKSAERVCVVHKSTGRARITFWFGYTVTCRRDRSWCPGGEACRRARGERLDQRGYALTMVMSQTKPRSGARWSSTPASGRT